MESEMKTEFIKNIENKFGIEIRPKYKDAFTNNFAKAKEVMATAINKECFEYTMSSFRSYYLKQYCTDSKDMVYNIVVEEENPANSGFSLYEFAHQWGVYSMYFTFEFDVYGLLFSNESRLIKNISIEKNTIKFKYRRIQSSYYRTLCIVTRDNSIKELLSIINAMQTGSQMAFENREFYKKKDGVVKTCEIFPKSEAQ